VDVHSVILVLVLVLVLDSKATFLVLVTSSPSVLSRTQELAPEGVVGLAVNISSARSVLVYWTPVSAANGLLRYDVYFTGPFYTQRKACSICRF